MTRKRFALVVLVAAALAGLLTVGTWASMRAPVRPTQTMMGNGYGPAMMGGGYGPGMMGGGAGMMAGVYGLPGNGRRVDSLAAARQRARAYADRLGLRTGEVIEFSNGFYAELLTGDGSGATEVLVDRSTGAVGVEYGPAMMWNISYGMHAGAAVGGVGAVGGAPAVSAADVGRLAQRWLDDQRHGLTAGEPELFPGYYAVETLRGGKIDGMLSVNATTGAVWYHTWHGSFVAASEQ
jgi:hypothetical protein